MMNKAFFKKNSGFSLIELSILISFAAIAAVGYLNWANPPAKTEAKKIRDTVERMNAIHKAMENFRIRYSRLPCPASQTLAVSTTATSSVYDIESSQTVSGRNACTTLLGAVPTSSLGLSSDYMMDGWGNKFYYQLNGNYCTTTACDQGSFNNPTSTAALNLKVRNITGTYATQTALYVLLSYGTNGLGAYLPSGSRMSVSADTSEAENSNGDVVFVQDNRTSTYDDLVTFRTKTQLDNLASQPVQKLVSQQLCNLNSKAIAGLTASDATSLRTNVTALARTEYDYTKMVNATTYQTKSFNSGDDVVLDILWNLQEACTEYYGNLTGINGSSYTGQTNVVSVNSAASTVTAPTGSFPTIYPGSIIRLSGFNSTSNNGFFYVSAVSPSSAAPTTLTLKDPVTQGAVTLVTGSAAAFSFLIAKSCPSGGKYNAMTNTCSCPNGTWGGSC